jgi:hypothetical protein
MTWLTLEKLFRLREPGRWPSVRPYRPAAKLGAWRRRGVARRRLRRLIWIGGLLPSMRGGSRGLSKGRVAQHARNGALGWQRRKLKGFVRFTPENGGVDLAEPPIASSVLLRESHLSVVIRCTRNELPPFHSITSSASANKVGGRFRPSALAVFRLMTNSNFAGCTTGRSAGFSPFRMRPVYTPIWR